VCDVLGIFKYKKDVAKLTEDTDEFTIPDKYVEGCEEYALYKCYKQTGDSNWQVAFGEYERIFAEMENDYAMQIDNKNKKIKSIYA
jgi:hypothetical protein